MGEIMSFWSDIEAFHKKFGWRQQKKPAIPQVRTDLITFRIKFIEEELNELKAAIGENKTDDALDALVDLTYVIIGTAWLFNLPFNAAWKEVHKANMKKVRGRSKRSYYYDCIKPKGWQSPNIQKVIDNYKSKLKERENVSKTKR